MSECAKLRELVKKTAWEGEFLLHVLEKPPKTAVCYNWNVNKAYGMLGILFVIVFLIAYFALK